MIEAESPVEAPAIEFPAELVPLLRCPADAGTLRLLESAPRGEIGIVDGQLECESCSAVYRIDRGIARMLPNQLAAEDWHEIAIRDKEHAVTEPGEFVPPEFGWRSRLMDLLEIPPHLDALQPLDGRLVLELGCGDGRFTLLMAQAGARVLAIDFSMNALRKVAWRLPSGKAPTSFEADFPYRGRDLRGKVGLVHADASQFRLAPRSFDRALSATPLDTREQRMKMYDRICDALKDEGRFVGGVEHDDLTRRLLGLPEARRYSQGGIFIEHFSAITYRRELAPHFARLRIRPIRPRVPFARRLPLKWGAAVSRAAGAVPLLRQLGELLLARAEGPIRPPAEGANRPGNPLAKWAYRWYAKRLGKPPVWQEHEPV